VKATRRRDPNAIRAGVEATVFTCQTALRIGSPNSLQHKRIS